VIADVLHLSFTVRDIERSTDWYTRVLGLELVHRQRADSAYTRKLVGIPAAILEIAFLAVPDVRPARSDHVLELIEYVVPAPAADRPRELPTNEVGVAHLALMVTDLQPRYERMLAEGVRFRSAPVEITAGLNAGGWACYLHDPDGITIELLQPSPARLLAMGLEPVQ
jgi:catechol 2,3-dioxygenase-like lactoylglutathione lyase family enzyme